jgi:hypothetical protein
MLGLARLWHIVLLVRARLEARAVGNFRLRIALLLGFSIANVGVGALLYKLASGPGAVTTQDALFTVYSASTTFQMLCDLFAFDGAVRQFPLRVQQSTLLGSHQWQQE